MKDIVAVVLAAGEGKRFWPIETNKSLISFLGKSLLVHNLERLGHTGIKNVIVVIPAHDQIKFDHFNVSGLSITTVVQPEANGMAQAFLAASEKIGNRACLVTNAEDLVDEKLYTQLSQYLGGQKTVLVGKKMTEYFPGGYFVIEGGKATGIVEKPGAGSQPSQLVKLVFDYFPNAGSFADCLRTTKSEIDDVYEKALNKMLKDTSAQIISYDGYWWPTKYPWHILDVMNQLLFLVPEHRGIGLEIKQNVVIEGRVFIGDNVKIFENTKIVGPCFIGDNTIIGDNNMIRNSHIGKNCVTGFSSDITRSYVGDNCWFHSNYVGDSVLEGNVSMGSGTVLANLRLDEGHVFSSVRGEKKDTRRNKLGAIIGANVRIGVNVSVMPGIKIGSGSFIGAGSSIAQDVPDGSFCFTKSQLEVIKNTKSSEITSRDEFKRKI